MRLKFKKVQSSGGINESLASFCDLIVYGDALMDCIDSGRLCILLAEDNPINQRVEQRMLNRLGYPVDMAANGLEALQALEHQSYNIILMDIQMPEMDGLEATRIIRQRLSAEKQPRIIALTAHALDYSREICIDAGMDNYISKPVQKDDLAEVLEKAAHELHIGGRSGHLTHLRFLFCLAKHLIRSTRIVSISKL